METCVPNARIKELTPTQTADKGGSQSVDSIHRGGARQQGTGEAKQVGAIKIIGM